MEILGILILGKKNIITILINELQQGGNNTAPRVQNEYTAEL